MLLFGRADWTHAVPVISAITASNALAGYTWWLLVRRFANAKGTVTAWEAIRVFYVAQALGSVTPMNVGNDLYRAHVTRSSDISLRHAFTPIVLQRLTSSLVTVALGGMALIALPLPTAVGRLLGVTFAGLFAGGVLVLCLLATHNAWVLRKLGLPEITPRALVQGSFMGLALALVFHLVGAGLAYLLATALAADVPWLQLLAAILLARATALIPFSVAGLGFMEGALAALLPLVGGTAELGLGVALLQRVSWLLTIILGAGLWALRPAPAPVEPPPPPEPHPSEPVGTDEDLRVTSDRVNVR